MAEDRELARAIVLLQKLPGRIDALASLASQIGASSMAATPLALDRNRDLKAMREALRDELAAALPVLQRYYQASLQKASLQLPPMTQEEEEFHHRLATAERKHQEGADA